MVLLAPALPCHLPVNYLEALPIFLKIRGSATVEDDDRNSSGFQIRPRAYFVEFYGRDHFEESMNALDEITTRSTS